MNAPETVEFDYFSSTNFIGLFITEQFASLLKQITTDFAEEMKKAGKIYILRVMVVDIICLQI